MITVVFIYYIPTLNNNPPTPSQFLRDKIFKKKLGKRLLNKLLNLNWGALGPLVVLGIQKLIAFKTKKDLQGKYFRVNYYFWLNIMQKAMYLASLRTESITKCCKKNVRF